MTSSEEEVKVVEGEEEQFRETLKGVRVPPYQGLRTEDIREQAWR